MENQKYNKHIDKLIKKSKGEDKGSVNNESSKKTHSKRATHFAQYPTLTFYDPYRPEFSRVLCPDLNLFEAIDITEFTLNNELIGKEALAKKRLLIKMKNHLEARKKASIPYPEISMIKDLALKKSKKKGTLIPVKLVAKIIGLSEQGLRIRCNKGLVPHYRAKGVKRFFYLEEILLLACEEFKKNNPEFF